MAYITDGVNAYAFYFYEPGGMGFTSGRVLIGHMFGGQIYGLYDNAQGTRLLRPDEYLTLRSK